jgi:phosphoglycerate dehydrogenase-like enzyme
MRPMEVVFGEPDKMFRLIGEALAPSVEGPAFLKEFFLTENTDPAPMLRKWSAKRQVPRGVKVVHCDDPRNLADFLRSADVLVAENQHIGAAEIEAALSLKLIQIFGRDTSNIDLATCRRRSVTVRSLDRYSNRLVAEHVVMLMLALTRSLNETQSAVRRPSALPPSGWAFNWPACRTVKGLLGRTVGLIGLGHVGTLVAEYLRPFGANVLYTRRNRDRRVEERLGIAYAGLDELVAKSDVLSIHVPGNAQTRHLVDATLLKKAKPGVMIVNAARGAIIDEDALLNALRAGAVGGAALDVFSIEPLPLDHPFQKLPNIILTPHVAAGTRDEDWLDAEIGPVIDSILSVIVR